MPVDIDATSLPPSAALRYFRDKLNVPTERWTDLWKGAHARAFSVAGATSEGLLTDFRQAVMKGIAQGTTLQEFRRDFDRIVKEHGWEHTGTAARRAKLIYQTNLNMALAAGRYAEMTEPATLALYPYWQYVHSGSRHPRLQHLAWNGMILRADDPFWATHYPPNGWHCGCQVRVVSEGDMRRMGRSGPDPSPPITYRGWRNPRTGELERVPVGIDPGFDYNPGKVWAETVPKPAPPRPSPAAPTPRPTAPSVTPHEWPSVQAADSDLTDASKPWAASLAERERRALAEWKGAAGREINRAARGESDNVLAARLAVDLQAGIAKARAPRPLRVFRGVAPVELAQLQGRPTGSVVRPQGFTATSLDPTIAARLGETVIQVLVPEGQPGAAYIHPWPSYRYPQYEMLLNRETAYRVFEVDGVVVLEAIEDGG